MPDRPPTRHEIERTLTAVHHAGHLIGVRCSMCSGKARHYYPADLVRLFGDLPVVVAAQRMRCEKCGHHDYLRAEIISVSAAERQKMKVRRLVGVRTKKLPVWGED